MKIVIDGRVYEWGDSKVYNNKSLLICPISVMLGQKGLKNSLCLKCARPDKGKYKECICQDAASKGSCAGTA